MAPSRDEVLEWLQGTMRRPLTPAQQADLLFATDRIGEDADALIEAFARRFGVEMSGFDRAMHCHDERRLLLPHWPIPSPPRHGAWVPLSVTQLHRAAVEGRWPVVYPTLPVVRDLSWLNPILTIPGLVAATALVLWLVPTLS